MVDNKPDDILETMDDINAADGIDTAVVEGFAPGTKVKIASLTAGDIIEFTEENQGEAKRTAGLRLICKSLVNSKGERYASDPKNIATFRKKSHKSTERIVAAIMKLNGIEIGKGSAAKNDSGGAPDAASSTVLH